MVQTPIASPAPIPQEQTSTVSEQEYSAPARQQETIQEEPQKKRAGRPPGGGKSSNGNGKTTRPSKALKPEYLLQPSTIEIDGQELNSVEVAQDWLSENVIEPCGFASDLAFFLDFCTQAWVRNLGRQYTSGSKMFQLRMQTRGLLALAGKNPEFASTAPELIGKLLSDTQQGLRDASPTKKLPQATGDAIGF